MSYRTEKWVITDDNARQLAAMVDVRSDDTVVVSYELLAQMLTDLGYVRQVEA